MPSWPSFWTPACRAWGAANMTTRKKLSGRRIYRQSIDEARESIDLHRHLRDQTSAGRPMAEFQQVLPGQSLAQIRRLRHERLRVTPAMQARLNERQSKMLVFPAQGDEPTSRKCQTLFSVTRDTANRDFSLLMEMGLLTKVGRGRSTRNVLREADPNRQGIVR